MTSAAVAGIAAGAIRSAQPNQYHHSPLLPSAAAAI